MVILYKKVLWNLYIIGEALVWLKQSQENNQQNQSKEELSKEEIDQILNALEREEKEVQEDLQEKKVIGGDKLLKDW